MNDEQFWHMIEVGGPRFYALYDGGVVTMGYASILGSIGLSGVLLWCFTVSDVAPDMDDTRLANDLETAIHGAVADKVSALRAEAVVDRKAVLNTTRGQLDRDRLAIVDLGPDPFKPNAFPSFNAARDVVYWKRPDNWPEPRIVGIVYNDDDSSSVFYAIVYPP